MTTLTLPIQYDYNIAFVDFYDGHVRAWTYVPGRKQWLDVPNDREEAIKQLQNRSFMEIRQII